MVWKNLCLPARKQNPIKKTKKNNLKEAAKTFSYLSQHNLLNYEEFQNHVADLEASIHATDNKIQQTRLAIQNQQVIQKHCEVYRACRDIIRAQNLVFTNFRRLKNCSDNRWNWKKNCPQQKKKSRIFRSNRIPCI